MIVWLICHLQFRHILETFGLSVIYSFAIYRKLLTLTLMFDLILKNLNLGCYLVIVAARRALLSSDNSYGLSVINSFVTGLTHFLSFTVLSQIGHFWLICHSQFSHKSGTFGLPINYMFCHRSFFI